MKGLKQYILIAVAGVVSGLLMSVILPNELAANGLSMVSLVALVPVLLMVYRGLNKRQLLLLSIFWGTTHAWLGRYWLANFQEFGVTILVALSVGLSLVSFLALLLLSYIVRQQQGESRIWRTTWLWVSFEYLRSHGFLADPWALLAYGFNQSRYVIQVIDLVGIFGLSFIAALANALVTEFLILKRRDRLADQGWRQPLLVWLIVVVSSAGYGAWAIRHYSSDREESIKSSWNIVLVQQNMDSWSRHWTQLVEAHMLAVDSIKPFRVQPDLIVSSETTLLGDFETIFSQAEFRPHERTLADFIREQASPHLFGALALDDHYLYNGAFWVDEQAQELEHSYYKQQLVPFAEGLPLRQWSWLGYVYRRILDTTHLMHSGGAQDGLFFVSNAAGQRLAFAVPICFEDAFPHITRKFVRQGAELLINITNDSWSQRLTAQTQHMAIARYRAIETRRIMLRAANSGMTVHIDRNGVYEAMLEPFVSGALETTVQLPLKQSLSVYTYLGDVIAYMGLIMSAGYVLLSYSQSPESSLFRSLKKVLSRFKRAE